ncbi:MAG: type I-E CRISPR-associated protein Cas5/CasD, partial [Clostridiales bacterium]|nr:type I-E CRISPR-associated protein Cas5/CasD [Clostridiales bacterium]
MKLLLMKLEGALQSYGEWAKWDTRDSAQMPTKSAVIGLIACCMGIPRYDERINELHKKLQFAVRNDRPGSMMTDFHTVQSDNMRIAKGGEKKHTILSPRMYIMDCAFMVALSVNDASNEYLIDSCAKALKSPVWVPYLGRKSCVPSSPLFYGITEEYSSA